MNNLTGPGPPATPCRDPSIHGHPPQLASRKGARHGLSGGAMARVRSIEGSAARGRPDCCWTAGRARHSEGERGRRGLRLHARVRRGRRGGWVGAGGGGVRWGGGALLRWGAGPLGRWSERAVRQSAALDGGLARPDALVRCMAAVQGSERHPSQNGEEVWEFGRRGG